MMETYRDVMVVEVTCDNYGREGLVSNEIFLIIPGIIHTGHDIDIGHCLDEERIVVLEMEGSYSDFVE